MLLVCVFSATCVCKTQSEKHTPTACVCVKHSQQLFMQAVLDLPVQMHMCQALQVAGHFDLYTSLLKVAERAGIQETTVTHFCIRQQRMQGKKSKRRSGQRLQERRCKKRRRQLQGRRGKKRRRQLQVRRDKKRRRQLQVRRGRRWDGIACASYLMSLCADGQPVMQSPTYIYIALTSYLYVACVRWHKMQLAWRLKE
jgi:hypothetical protein